MGTGPRNKVRGRSGRVLGRSVAEFEGWGGKYSCQADDFGPFSLFSRHFWRFRKLYDVHLVRRIYGREARKQGSFRLNWSLLENKKLKLISQTTFLISQTSLEKKLKTLKYREATGKLSTLVQPARSALLENFECFLKGESASFGFGSSGIFSPRENQSCRASETSSMVHLD